MIFCDNVGRFAPFVLNNSWAVTTFFKSNKLFENISGICWWEINRNKNERSKKHSLPLQKWAKQLCI